MAAVASSNCPVRVKRVASSIPASILSLMASVSFRLCRSANSIRQRGFHGCAGMQGAEHDHGFNRRTGQLGCYVVSDGGQAQHLDLQPLAGCLHRLEVATRVVLQAEDERLAG